MMVSPTHIKEKGPNVDRVPVGTGPWKFESFRDNDRFIVTRNEKYWRPGLPYLDGVNIAIFSETGHRAALGYCRRKRCCLLAAAAAEGGR